MLISVHFHKTVIQRTAKIEAAGSIPIPPQLPGCHADGFILSAKAIGLISSLFSLSKTWNTAE